MNDNLIITIGRQFGSGGREIGKRLADLFGIAYYDKELINEASKSSGLSTEYFEKADERAPSALLNSFSINWLTGAGGIWGDGGLSNEYIFKFQSDVIRHLAETQSCVIVGRCADYILRQYPRCYNVFIHAPLEDRIERIISRSQGMTRKEAIELAEKKNKLRASYYFMGALLGKYKHVKIKMPAEAGNSHTVRSDEPTCLATPYLNALCCKMVTYIPILTQKSCSVNTGEGKRWHISRGLTSARNPSVGR